MKTLSLSIIVLFILQGSIACADSTKISPAKVIPQYRSTITTHLPIQNVAYPTNKCPVTPQNCPKTDAAGPVTCPDLCFVEGITATTLSGSGKVIPVSTEAPVCPVGYVVTTTYSMEKEVAKGTPPAYQYPIPYNDYFIYLDYGWTCYSNPTWESAPNRHCGSYGSTNPSPVGSIASKDGKAIMWKSDDTRSCCWSGSNCGGSCSTCGGAFWWYKEIVQQYAYMMCNQGPALYFTGNLVPMKAVCARIAHKWKPA